MKRRHLVFIAVIFALCACGPADAPDVAAPLGSRIELAAGDVWLGLAESQKRLITGAMLPASSDITVATGGRALIRLGNGTGIFLRGGTTVHIEADSVKISSGEIWTDVPDAEGESSRFEVGNTTVTASGTGFDLAVENDQVVVYVARGLAVVASPGGRAEVNSGERALVKKDKEPTVEPVSFWEDWTGGMADRELLAGIGGKATGRIYGIDRNRPGSTPKEMQISSLNVKTIIRDGIANTTVDQVFFNPASTQVEGWYWFTVPEGAAVERFAWEIHGQLVEGEMVERKKAADTYEAIVRQNTVDPALLEWIDGRTFRARIFPIPATGHRRILLSYTELLPLADGVYRYVYPMSGAEETLIQEFSLNVNLGDTGEKFEISTISDARVEKDRSSISMRRSGFVPRADFLLELKPVDDTDPLRALRYSSGKDEADYIMLRYSPEVDWSKQKEVPGDVVVVLDTSAGGDESERQTRSETVEAILRALSGSDHFAVVATDLTPRVIYPSKGMADANEENILAAVEKLAEISSAGATDIGQMFAPALELVHSAPQPALVYVGDGRATVGEISADDLTDRLKRTLGDSRARLFTIAVGADANYSLLERLARVGGGRAFRIDTADQTVQEALRFAGMVKTPTLTDLKIDAGPGLDQVFTTATGKLSEGDEVILVARSHHALPTQITVSGNFAGESIEKVYETREDTSSKYDYIPSVWARMYLSRLMGEGAGDNRGSILALGLNYSLMTPYSSFLVLENDDAYRMQGIQRRHRSRRWSWLQNEGDSLAVKDAAGFPLFLFGCSRSKSEDGEHAAAMERPEMLHKNKAPASGRGMEQDIPAPQQMDYAQEAKAEAPKKMRTANYSSGGKGKRRRAAPSDDLSEQDAVGGLKADRLMRFETEVIGADGTMDGYGRGAGASDSRVLNIAKPFTKPKPIFKVQACSDASRRPLHQRRILWNSRLRAARSSDDYYNIFVQSGERCELPRWRHRKILLDLIESRVDEPDDVQQLLKSFRKYPAFQKYLAKQIRRRSLDPDLTMGIYFPGGVNWSAIKTGLATLLTPEDRLIQLRKILERHPEDPTGRALLVSVLIENELLEEAIAEASRLRRDGLAGPGVLADLCDLQADAGLQEAARRTCSELVEFNAQDPALRKKLGDLFMRHGWYEDAYRQYRTLVESVQKSPIALLRMAAAAAGMGKIDEALRIERKVASGDGEPGPFDPRKWARLHSATKLAAMILEAKKNGETDKVKALKRSLKRTQLFGVPSTMTILVWEDMDAALELVALASKKEIPISQRINAAPTGLVMLDLGQRVPSDLSMEIKLQGEPLRRSVGYSLITLSWDGKAFSLNSQQGELAPSAKSLSI